jgi:uncharacterized protein YciI
MYLALSNKWSKLRREPRTATGKEFCGVTMLFVIEGIDGTDGVQKRAAHHEAHYAHMVCAAEQGIRIVLAGPLLQDDGETPMASLIIVEAVDRATVEAFQQRDPFHLEGIWRKTTIRLYRGRSS